MAVDTIAAQYFPLIGRTIPPGELDVSPYFADPDGDSLIYTAEATDPGVASVSTIGSIVSIGPVGPGHTTVVVTAQDPSGLAAEQRIGVEVGEGFRDDFESSESLIDWKIHYGSAEVSGGVLRLTERSQTYCSYAERSVQELTSWNASARMARAEHVQFTYVGMALAGSVDGQFMGLKFAMKSYSPTGPGFYSLWRLDSWEKVLSSYGRPGYLSDLIRYGTCQRF